MMNLLTLCNNYEFSMQLIYNINYKDSAKARYMYNVSAVRIWSKRGAFMGRCPQCNVHEFDFLFLQTLRIDCVRLALILYTVVYNRGQ